MGKVEAKVLPMLFLMKIYQVSEIRERIFQAQVDHRCIYRI